MKRTRLTLPLLLVVAFSQLAQPAQLARAAERPNILFIFSDDHATEAISAYSGGKLNNTPNLDRIAREGMLFRNSFCANSICGPSRANILTGKHSHKNGFLNNEQMRFDGSQMTFPKLLRNNGYQTALMGKWHLVTDPTGFDKWEILPGQGSYYNPHFLQMDGTRRQRAGYCTDIVTDLALDWLREDRDPDKPFLLMCQHKAPHRNWSPAPRRGEGFDDRDLPMPPTQFDNYSNRSKTLAQQKMSIAKDMYWGHDMKFHGKSLFPGFFLEGIGNGEYKRMTPGQRTRWDAVYEPRNQDLIARMRAGRMSNEEIIKWKYQRYIKDYLRTVQAVDDSVGRLLDHLDATGLSENTVVIYSSDQGFYLGEHGWYDKRWMFEESLEMPFLIRWPGVVDAGATSHALIQNIDYAPTFLEMAGIEAPEEIQGASIIPVLKDKGRVPNDWRDAIYYTYYGERTHAVAAHDGVRTTQHKLMFFPKTREWNLFDLVADPRELRSVHADPNYAGVLESLKNRYHDLRRGYEVNTATIPASRTVEDWWFNRWKAQNKATARGPGELLFVGDSITQGWEGRGKDTWEKYYADRGAINLGFSGDRTEHALWRLEKGNFKGVDNPKLAVVMIGTNNTGHFDQDPAETARGVTAVVGKLRARFPDMKVLLLGVFPRGAATDDPKRKLNSAINERIARLDDGDAVHYLDISSAFLGQDGELSRDIMPDLLHLNKEGYQLWAAAIEAKVVELGGFAPLK